jgi:hypothetical protein
MGNNIFNEHLWGRSLIHLPAAMERSWIEHRPEKAQSEECRSIEVRGTTNKTSVTWVARV